MTIDHPLAGRRVRAPLVPPPPPNTITLACPIKHWGVYGPGCGITFCRMADGAMPPDWSKPDDGRAASPAWVTGVRLASMVNGHLVNVLALCQRKPEHEHWIPLVVAEMARRWPTAIDRRFKFGPKPRDPEEWIERWWGKKGFYRACSSAGCTREAYSGYTNPPRCRSHPPDYR